jgi:hypothetical protein
MANISNPPLTEVIRHKYVYGNLSDAVFRPHPSALVEEPVTSCTNDESFFDADVNVVLSV